MTEPVIDAVQGICGAKTKAGTPCQRRVKVAPCFHHAKTFRLRVRALASNNTLAFGLTILFGAVGLLALGVALYDHFHKLPDSYYEPSIQLSHRRRGIVDLIEVHNLGRTTITINCAKAHVVSGPEEQIETFRTPVVVSYGSSNGLDTDLTNRLIKDVIVSGGIRELTLYLTTENEKRWAYHALVSRCPISEGPCVYFAEQRQEVVTGK